MAVRKLSPKEKEVMVLCFNGYTTSEIATKLLVSEETIKYHRSNIISKYGAKNMVHVAAIHFQTPIEGESLPDLQQTIFLARVRNHLRILIARYEEELNSELAKVLKRAMKDLRF